MRAFRPPAVLLTSLLGLTSCSSGSHGVPVALSPKVTPQPVAAVGDTQEDVRNSIRSISAAGGHPVYTTVRIQAGDYEFPPYAQVLADRDVLLVRASGRIFAFPIDSSQVIVDGKQYPTRQLPHIEIPEHFRKQLSVRMGSYTIGVAGSQATRENRIASMWLDLKDPWQLQAPYQVNGASVPRSTSASRTSKTIAANCSPSVTDYGYLPCSYYYSGYIPLGGGGGGGYAYGYAYLARNPPKANWDFSGEDYCARNNGRFSDTWSPDIGKATAVCSFPDTNEKQTDIGFYFNISTSFGVRFCASTVTLPAAAGLPIFVEISPNSLMPSTFLSSTGVRVNLFNCLYQVIYK